MILRRTGSSSSTLTSLELASQDSQWVDCGNTGCLLKDQPQEPFPALVEKEKEVGSVPSSERGTGY